ncbi:hypothetical protein RND71_043596 [Anisodus tanguticus]|uniref:C-CAP/cofactor C-like domain-containing protein n=1 Tax=Anisodus tanguticus TaxID=243964 RepID=A0AAE1QPD7_9SOLA|nr:hypothetical protein RND71_043596 [Anisodus tanguticus]
MSSSIIEFQELIDTYFVDFINLSNVIGDDVLKQADLVKEAINENKNIIEIAAKCKKPADAQIQSLIKPLANKIEQVQQFREKNRTSKYFNHLSTLSESIPALGWVVVSPTPAPYVKEMSDSGQFYGNKVLVSYKDKDENHRQWVNSWYNFLANLQKYIRKNHTTGLTWNIRGCDFSPMNAGALSSGAPLPPPPPPPPAMTTSYDDNNDLTEIRSALMKDLNVGTDITKGLRKVTKDQQTHKNLALRNLPPCPVSNKNTCVLPEKKLKDITHPPKLCLEGRKWLVEYQEDQKDLAIQINEMSESIHLYKCRNSLLIVKGKANSLILDSCIKTSVVFDDIVSSVEMVNCQDIKIQNMLFQSNSNQYGKEKWVMNAVDNNFQSTEAFQAYSKLRAQLWSAIDNEINFNECDIYR